MPLQTTREIARKILDSDPVFLDTETTGLDTDDQIVEIGIIGKTGTALINKLVKATKASHQEALAVHGISEEKLEEFGEEWSVVMPVINAIFDCHPVAIFNAVFDMRMLEQTCLAHGLNKPLQTTVYDIMELANIHFVRYAEWDTNQSKFKRLSLAKCCEIAGIEYKGSAHRAVVDCHAILDLLKFLASDEGIDQFTLSESFGV